MESAPGMLLIGAADRNAGKTTFACQVIERVARARAVVAAKVTTVQAGQGHGCPRGGEGCGVCRSLEVPYVIEREVADAALAGKDSQRMLAAGAAAVLWLKVRTDAAQAGAQALWTRVTALRQALAPASPDEVAVVCESNRLRLALTPDLFLLLRGESEAVKASAAEVWPLKSALVWHREGCYSLEPGALRFDAGKWFVA